ncbi:hypothetical protein [Enterococcus malodoratus]|nr:hypothetical protein [Enterococcus malodoratus]
MNDLGTIKLDEKENPKEIVIETKSAILTINAEGFVYKIKKSEEATK